MTATARTYQAVVSAGIALLDKDKADWRTRINAGTLDLADGDHCILAQSYPASYYWIILGHFFSQLSANEDRQALYKKEARAHGFSLRYEAQREEFEELRDEWLRQIREAPMK